MLNAHSQKDRKLVFKTNYRLMQVKSTAECSKGSILQYFRPSLSYHLSLGSLFCLFLGGRFTQVVHVKISNYGLPVYKGVKQGLKRDTHSTGNQEVTGTSLHSSNIIFIEINLTIAID